MHRTGSVNTLLQRREEIVELYSSLNISVQIRVDREGDIFFNGVALGKVHRLWVKKFLPMLL